jgi:hypothetical protein
MLPIDQPRTLASPRCKVVRSALVWSAMASMLSGALSVDVLPMPRQKSGSDARDGEELTMPLAGD